MWMLLLAPLGFTFIRICFLLAWVFGPLLPADAQDTSCLHRTLPFSVHDSHGLQFLGLTATDFQAKFRGKPVKTLSVRPDNRPHRVVILLDTSGSMRGQMGSREWKIASTVAAHIGQSDLKNTSFALLLFSDSVREQIGLSQGNSAVANRLLEIWSDPSYAKQSVRGRTALLDTILSALRLLGDSGFSDSVYVISDGGDNVSRTHLQNIRKALAAGGVRLHVTLLGPESLFSSISPQEASGAKDLIDLAIESGGLIVGPLGLEHSGYNLPEKQRRALATQLSLMYLGMTRNDLMEIELRQPVNKWMKWSLASDKESLQRPLDRLSTATSSLQLTRQLGTDLARHLFHSRRKAPLKRCDLCPPSSWPIRFDRRFWGTINLVLSRGTQEHARFTAGTRDALLRGYSSQ